MRNPLHIFVAISLLALTAVACSGASTAVKRKLPEPMAERCRTATHARAAGLADGSFQPIALRRADDPAQTPWTEQQAADHLLTAKPGAQTWVIARGGSGKSKLAWSLEALTCGQRLTFRVDVGLDLRAKLELATASQPAIAGVLLGQLGVRAGEDPAGQLRDALGDTPWLLLLDGTDELTVSERRRMDAELDWLEKAEFSEQIVRFERPGMVDAKPTKAPELVLALPDMTCAEADAVLVRRFPDPTALQAAQAWLAAHKLDRKRGGATCRYVHMSTHRDAETMADLAEDARAAVGEAAGLDDLAMDPVRSELYATWLAHWLHGITSTTDGALSWLDRIAAQGVIDKREPDLRLSVNRCEGVAAPGGGEAGGACRRLMQSPVVRKGEASGVAALANRTLMDLLLARWLVKGQTDCALLTSATGEMASLEIAAMVASLPDGRRCLNPIVAAICSRGIAPDDIIGFVDQAVPVGTRDAAFFAIAQERAQGACEHGVFAGLQAK